MRSSPALLAAVLATAAQAVPTTRSVAAINPQQIVVTGWSYTGDGCAATGSVSLSEAYLAPDDTVRASIPSVNLATLHPSLQRCRPLLAARLFSTPRHDRS
jgi:phospholipase/lecithinase/hemolysin